MSPGELIASLAANFIVAGVVWYLRGPNAGLICLGIGLVLLIVAFFVRKRPSPQVPSQQNTQSVKVEANPQQHVHIDADILRQVKDLPKPEPLPPEPKPQPNIRFVESRDADIYHSDDTVFHETQRGLGDSKVTIVCFRNESIEGRRIPSVDVRAHVIYRDADGQEITDMPSGVWLEEYKGHADFTPGIKRCLIVFFLTNQGTLKKLWKEAYRHEQSWMSGEPSYRVRDEAIRGRVTTVEIRLLSESHICVLKKMFKVEVYENGVLPKLTILPG